MALGPHILSVGRLSTPFPSSTGFLILLLGVQFFHLRAKRFHPRVPEKLREPASHVVLILLLTRLIASVRITILVYNGTEKIVISEEVFISLF